MLKLVASSSYGSNSASTTAAGLPAHSLTTLLDDLATLALNTVHLPDNPEHRFAVVT